MIGLVCESTGVVLLKKGIARAGDIQRVNYPEIARIVKVGISSPCVLLGIFFEALFFACLLILMSRSDISFLWPLTGLSFVFATFAAILFLGESVSAVRWAGVVLIMLGAAFISYSEHSKPKPPPIPADSKVEATTR